MSCITTSSISILVNGKTTTLFYPTREIRQGDPLSLYIFIMCMEKLFKTINKMVHEKCWTPISVSSMGSTFSHLLFVNNFTLFSRASPENYHVINLTLNTFFQGYGQKLNLIKSKILFSSNCNIENANLCSSILSIPASKNFEKYLGFPMFQCRLTKNDFHYIIDRM